jgi:hypothetical protein
VLQFLNAAFSAEMSDQIDVDYSGLPGYNDPETAIGNLARMVTALRKEVDQLKALIMRPEAFERADVDKLLGPPAAAAPATPKQPQQPVRVIDPPRRRRTRKKPSPPQEQQQQQRRPIRITGSLD